MKNPMFEKSRLTMLREMLGMSQKEFAENVGITQGALSQLETGKSKLSLDSLQKISLAFKANCNWLVNGKGDIFMKEASVNKVQMRDQVITMDINEVALIPMIREEAHAGYVEGYEDSEYLQTLDVYKIPGYEKGNYRLFEISGDSMLPTIHPREVVVCECCREWEKIENGTLCVVISEKGIVAKRTYYYEEDRSVLILKSDNSTYKTYSLPIDDIYEIWLIRAKITNIFSHGSTVDESKIQSLESDIKELQLQMRTLTGQNGSD